MPCDLPQHLGWGLPGQVPQPSPHPLTGGVTWLLLAQLEAALRDLKPAAAEPEPSYPRLVRSVPSLMKVFRSSNGVYQNFQSARPIYSDTDAAAGSLLAAILELRNTEDRSVFTGIYDIMSTMLFFLGKAGHITHWHLDRSEALNWALGVLLGEVDIDKPVAAWYFVHATQLAGLAEYYASLGLALTELTSPPGDEDIRRLALGYGVIVTKVEQHAGDVVRVEPGWAHFVETLQPCIKSAWDSYDPQNALLYVLAGRSIGAHFPAAPEDYVASLAVTYSLAQQM